ncbi:Gfo/Idh/MocA family protein [Pseudomonas sp. Ma2-10]
MIRIGLIGAGFIGQMHALAFRNAAMASWSPKIDISLVALADQNIELAAEAQKRYGFERITTDWREVAGAADIDLLINCGPNHLHAEPSIAAAKAGKAVFCEKPLAGSADQAYQLWKGVEATEATAMCAFMHRSIPALNLAREMIKSGELGEIRHFRSRFLLNMVTGDPLSWRFSRSQAGLGALGDLGSHHIDQARFLVGEVSSVAAMTNTWTKDPAGKVIDVNDDSFVCVAQLDNGASASFEASRVASAHNLGGFIEIDGSKRSIAFHMERLNELVIYEPKRGSRTQMVTQADHPYSDFWLPIGIQGQHPLGWNECFAHQARHMLEAIAAGKLIAPRATFEDGYRVAEIVETIARSAQSRSFETVNFRS